MTTGTIGSGFAVCYVRGGC